MNRRAIHTKSAQAGLPTSVGFVCVARDLNPVRVSGMEMFRVIKIPAWAVGKEDFQEGITSNM